MPTSSQALILKVTDGYLPPIFGRRCWRPPNANVYPIASIYVPERPLFQSRDQTAQNYRPGSALTIRNNGVLPDLLRIQGIKGDTNTDTSADTSTFHYDVDALPKPKRNNWVLGPVRTDNRLAVYRHANQNTAGSNRTTNAHTFSPYSQNGINRSSTDGYIRRHRTGPNLRHFHKFVKMEATGEVVQTGQSGEDEADFFKLVKVPERDTGPKANIRTFFRLIKASPLDKAAFRLAKTGQREVGEFYLVPPDGCESDDFRLLPSDYPGCYTILQADPHTHNSYRQVKSEDVHGPEFRFVSAKVRDSPIIIPGSLQSNENANEAIDIPPNQRFSEWRTSQMRSRVDETHSVYDFYNDIHDLPEAVREALGKDFSLPDIMLNDPNKFLHNAPYVQTGEDGSDFNAEEFASRYMDDLRENSAEVYERLVSLGFRRSLNDAQHPRFAAAKAGDNATGSGDLRAYNFDKWTRTTDAPNMSKLDQTQTPEEVEKASLMVELKSNSNYQLWKKKKVIGTRMRKELPPEDHNAVCLTMKDNAIAHDLLYEEVQQATGNQLTSLQFDPVSVHSQESDAKSQWILRFEEESVCDNLIDYGINILGTTYTVRRFNDVMREEHEAYKFSLLTQKYKEHKQREQKLKEQRLKEQMALKAEQRKMGKRIKPTQTPTAVK